MAAGGQGSIFREDPIALIPNPRAAELAAKLRTLPEDKQRKIEAVVDLFLGERSQ
jgi:hypothetical protein